MTNESRPRMMPVHSPILQVQQNLRDAEAENANLRDLLNESMTENAAMLQQVTAMNRLLYECDATLRTVQSDADKCIERLISALIDTGDALFKNYILAFAVRDVAPSMEELEQACETINKALSAHGVETITLRQQLADAQASHHSAMFLLDEAQSDCNGWHDAYVALLRWSQAAYKRLGGLMTIGVSMTPDAVTARLLVAAPANVSAEVDPFSAELAANLNCTEKDVYEYVVDSVGASGIQTVEGCHSAGLHSCYGELWTCKGCGNRFCDAEGSTDKIELCDDCWFKAQGEAK